MGQPGQAGSQFPGEDAQGRKIKDLERAVQQQAAANPLATAGIKAVPGGIIVEGSQTVEGPLVVNGDSEINGSMSINGPLILQPGIIENDALTDPVILSTAGLSQNNFDVSSSDSVYAQATVTVPDGYTRADVMCMVVAGAFNGSGGTDYLYVSSSINAVGGGETPQIADAGRYVSAAANGIRSLTGLSGGVITVGCRVRSGSGAWGTTGANFANTNAFIYFRR